MDTKRKTARRMDPDPCEICSSYLCDDRCKQIKHLASKLYDSDHLTGDLVRELCNISFKNEDALENVDLWGHEKYKFITDLEEALDGIERQQCVYCSTNYKQKDESNTEICEVCYRAIRYCGSCEIGTRDYKFLCKDHLHYGGRSY